VFVAANGIGKLNKVQVRIALVIAAFLVGLQPSINNPAHRLELIDHAQFKLEPAIN